MIDGICGKCPTGRTWNAQTKKCECPAGSDQINGNCVQKCSDNQLVDPSGLCYYCPINEVISGGRCVCKDGYSRDPSTQRCEVSFKPNQVIINGICAACSLNSVYDEK